MGHCFYGSFSKKFCLHNYSGYYKGSKLLVLELTQALAPNLNIKHVNHHNHPYTQQRSPVESEYDPGMQGVHAEAPVGRGRGGIVVTYVLRTLFSAHLENHLAPRHPLQHWLTVCGGGLGTPSKR